MVLPQIQHAETGIIFFLFGLELGLFKFTATFR